MSTVVVAVRVAEPSVSAAEALTFGRKARAVAVAIPSGRLWLDGSACEARSWSLQFIRGDEWYEPCGSSCDVRPDLLGGPT